MTEKSLVNQIERVDPYPEYKALFNIVPKERLDLKMTFPLTNENDINGNPVEAQVYWLKLEEANKKVEGKIFIPKQEKNNALVVFGAGLPGDSTTWMEEKHVSAFVKEGYTVFTARHLGTKVEPKRANVYIHCQERIAKGGNLGGDQIYGLQDFALEPATAINALGEKFSRIALIGHSAGALYHAYSLGKVRSEILAKVRNLISLSGFLGGPDERREQFGDLQEYYTFCRQYINMEDTDTTIKSLPQVFDTVWQNGVPDHIMVTQITSPKDEYITSAGAEKFQEFLGRGLNIIDQTQFEPEYHDLKNLRSKTLIRLLDPTHCHPKTRHSVIVQRRSPK
jgi:pimeloyl-ACP methyl ester carboxylesterase